MAGGLQGSLCSVISLVTEATLLMKKRIDGRTVKGLRIRQHVREQILTAYIELIREGVPSPTARETAKRAGLSLRVIFKHFSDLRALRLASFNRIQAQSREFSSEAIPVRASAAQRLEVFVQRHVRMLEFVTPIQRTAAMVEQIDPDVAEAMREARKAAVRDLARFLGPTLAPLSRGDRRALLTALHVVCSWPSWETLRAHYRLPPGRARAIITRIALAVLADTQRHSRAPAQAGAERGRSKRRRASLSVH